VPLLAAGGAASAKAAPQKALPSIPNTPAPGQPAAVPAWQAIASLGDRLKESLPEKSSGNDDVDFALALAPLLDAIAELASDRAAATRDPVIRKVSERLSRERLADLQTLIDWLEAKGHGAQ